MNIILVHIFTRQNDASLPCESCSCPNHWNLWICYFTFVNVIKQIKDFEMGRFILNYLSGSNRITSVLIRGSQKDQIWRKWSKGSRGQRGRETAREREGDGEREKERETDLKMLHWALKLEEGAASQGMQEASRSWKRFFQKECSLTNILILGLLTSRTERQFVLF